MEGQTDVEDGEMPEEDMVSAPGTVIQKPADAVVGEELNLPASTAGSDSARTSGKGLARDHRTAVLHPEELHPHTASAAGRGPAVRRYSRQPVGEELHSKGSAEGFASGRGQLDQALPLLAEGQPIFAKQPVGGDLDRKNPNGHAYRQSRYPRDSPTDPGGSPHRPTPHIIANSSKGGKSSPQEEAPPRDSTNTLADPKGHMSAASHTSSSSGSDASPSHPLPLPSWRQQEQLEPEEESPRAEDRPVPRSGPRALPGPHGQRHQQPNRSHDQHPRPSSRHHSSSGRAHGDSREASAELSDRQHIAPVRHRRSDADTHRRPAGADQPQHHRHQRSMSYDPSFGPGQDTDRRPFSRQAVPVRQHIMQPPSSVQPAPSHYPDRHFDPTRNRRPDSRGRDAGRNGGYAGPPEGGHDGPPQGRYADIPKGRHAGNPDGRHADTPDSRHAGNPNSRHAGRLDSRHARSQEGTHAGHSAQSHQMAATAADRQAGRNVIDGSSGGWARSGSYQRHDDSRGQHQEVFRDDRGCGAQHARPASSGRDKERQDGARPRTDTRGYDQQERRGLSNDSMASPPARSGARGDGRGEQIRPRDRRPDSQYTGPQESLR